MKCSVKVFSAGSYRSHQCSREGKYIEQEQPTLGQEQVEYDVAVTGANYRADALMWGDGTNRDWLPIYGPTEPKHYCGTHAPSKIKAKDDKKRAEREAEYKARQEVSQNWQTRADQVAAALGVEHGVYVVVSSSYSHHAACGVRLDISAVEKLLELLSTSA